MAMEPGGSLLTAGKMAERLGISPGAVKKLIEAQNIKPDQIKSGCKYYGAAALKKLQSAAGKQ